MSEDIYIEFTTERLVKKCLQLFLILSMNIYFAISYYYIEKELKSTIEAITFLAYIIIISLNFPVYIIIVYESYVHLHKKIEIVDRNKQRYLPYSIIMIQHYIKIYYIIIGSILIPYFIPYSGKCFDYSFNGCFSMRIISTGTLIIL
jgi:hypothetical protein